MKEVKLFSCEHCETQYSKKEDCKECEDHHVHPVEIVGVRYVAYRNCRTGYPTSINVRMSDGKTVNFRINT